MFENFTVRVRTINTKNMVAQAFLGSVGQDDKFKMGAKQNMTSSSKLFDNV